MTEANRAFWLLGGVLFAALMLPKLLSEGVFFDGLLYASISRNLAEGFGDYWSPRFSDTFLATFAEHPPLQLWLGAFAFRLFGDDIHVEKAYSLATFIATSAAMLLIWRRATSRCSRIETTRLAAVGAVPDHSEYSMGLRQQHARKHADRADHFRRLFRPALSRCGRTRVVAAAIVVSCGGGDSHRRGGDDEGAGRALPTDFAWLHLARRAKAATARCNTRDVRIVSGDGSPARADPCLPGGASLCGTLCFQSGDGEPFRRAG